jgi:hypothetical protein
MSPTCLAVAIPTCSLDYLASKKANPFFFLILSCIRYLAMPVSDVIDTFISTVLK